MRDFLTIKQELREKPFNISVVGHTNHGKTSLVRTITENIDFGEVRNEATTTTEIEYKSIRDGGVTVLTIYDTPGLEMADEAIEKLGLRITIDQAIEFFDDQQHSLELMVLKHIRDKTNLILYVINVTEPVEAPFPDEYLLMRRSGVPVIPVLNFCYIEDSYLADWEDFFKKEGGQIFMRFDAHKNTIDEHIDLFTKARAMSLSQLHLDFLFWWIKKLENKKTDRNRSCSLNIASLLMEAAAFSPKVSCQGKEKKNVKQTLRNRFVDEISTREWESLKQIALVHEFSEDTLESEFRNFEQNENWRAAVWNNARTEYGAVAASTTSGALIGGTIDAFVGGASFGMGAALGAAFGAAVGFFGGKYIVMDQDDRLGTLSVTVEPRTLGELLQRTIFVWGQLEQKGKARSGATKLESGSQKQLEKNLIELATDVQKMTSQRFDKFDGMGTWKESKKFVERQEEIALQIRQLKDQATVK